MASPTPPANPKLLGQREEHARQWLHNRAFAASISRDYHDWIVTAVFYAALHAVDTLLCHDGIAVSTHSTRGRALVGNRRYEQVHRHYEPLYKLSRASRYMAQPRQWVRYEDIPRHVLQRYLYPLEKSVRNLTGLAIDCPPLTLT